MNERSTIFSGAYRHAGETNCWLRAGEQVKWDYSDGEQVERSLLELVLACQDRSVFSAELAEKIVDWPTRYYFSPSRSNLLRPFASLLRGRVLEIGAGCGAVSRFIGEMATELVALEPSLARARVAAARCEGLHNVKVVVDDLESFTATGQRFDAVTLIGVLEYAHRFSTHDDAAMHWLRLARSLLNPGGVLLLAIENKLGLKYFAGAPEDHLGRPMLGIGDLYPPQGPRTYGRVELESMLHAAGFAQSGFALPFPDYKLPTSVLLSDGSSAMPGFDDGAALAEASVGRDADLGGNPLFPMDRTWAVLAGNGLLADLSNSFMVVAHADRVEHVYGADNANCSAYHYSVERHRAFCKQAAFVCQSDGRRVVLRRMLSEDEAPAVGYACFPVDEAYVDGESWARRLYRGLRVDGWQAAGFSGWLRDWARAVLAHHGISLDEVLVAGNVDQLLPGACIDMLPHNLIEDAQGGLHFIDLEWTREAGIPLGYLLFRGLFETLSACPPVARPHDEAELSFVTFMERVIETLRPGLLACTPIFASCVEMEREFQAAVSGGGPSLDRATLAASRLNVSPFLQIEGSAGAAVTTVFGMKRDLERLRQVYGQLEKDNTEVAGWARKLDDEISDLREVHARLQGEHGDAVQWAQTLDSELSTLREVHARLQSEYGDVVQWAQALDSELLTQRGVHARLQSEYSDAVQWAQALDSELSTLREVHARLQSEHGNAVQWAQTLDSELSVLRKVHACLQDEHAKGIAWAQGLDAEVAALRIIHTELQEEHRQQGQWAQGLASELEQSRLHRQQLQQEYAERVGELQALTHEKQVLQQDMERWGREVKEELARTQSELHGQQEAARSEWETVRVELGNRWAEYRDQRAQLLRGLEDAQRQRRELDAHLAQVLTSRSWVLTRPLRFLARLLRGE